MQNRRGHARMVLLSCASVLVALQLGTGAGLIWVHPNLFDRDYDSKICRLNQREKHYASGDYRVIMIGSSHTLNGFRPDELTQYLHRETGRNVHSFNFGLPGSCIFTNLIFLRRLLRDGHHPDLVLLEVLPAALHIEREAIQPPWELRLRLNELALARQYRVPWRLVYNWVTAHLLPRNDLRILLLTGHLPRLLRFLDPMQRLSPMDELSAMDEFGWLRNPFQEDAAKRANYLKVAHDEYAPHLARLEVGVASLNALRETIALCRANGIGIVMVLMPEGPVFRSWYSPETRRTVDATLQSLSSETGVSVIDARAWIDEEAFFVDSHHLLTAGASIFTHRLAEEVLAPMLRGQSLLGLGRVP